MKDLVLRLHAFLMKNYLYVDISKEILSNYHSGERFGDWETHYDCSISGVTLKGENLSIYRDKIEVDFEPTLGQQILIVSVTYSSGDTFGNSYGNLAIAGIYDSSEKAEEARRQVKNQEAPFDGCKEWNGYFERMGAVSITQFTIGL